MPEGERSFSVRTSITVSQAREFLNRAAHDDDFRELLETTPLQTLADYGVELSTDVVAACQVPPKEYCVELLKRVDEIDEYAEADYAPVAFATVVLTVGYAMPLVATT